MSRWLFQSGGLIWHDVDLTWHVTKCKPGLMSHVGEVLLTADQPAHSSTKLGHEMSLPGGGYIWSMWTKLSHKWPQDVSAWVSLLDVVPNLAMRCLCQWGISLHIDIFYIFCVWEYLELIVGEVTWTWQMHPTPRAGQEFKWNAPKHIFVSTFYSLSPKNFFQNSQCFRDCEPSEIYIFQSFLYKCETLEVYISLHIDIFYIFLSQYFWGGCFTC